MDGPVADCGIHYRCGVRARACDSLRLDVQGSETGRKGKDGKAPLENAIESGYMYDCLFSFFIVIKSFSFSLTLSLVGIKKFTIIEDIKKIILSTKKI